MKSERALIRKRAGFSQSKLAKLTGIHVTTISLWENYETELSSERVAKIGNAIAKELSRIQLQPTGEDVTRVLVGATA